MREPPLDQEQRDRALDPGASFHLEAPAGSGKTSVLLARFLTLLTRVKAPEELLALTFTRKAAGELRARLIQHLFPRAELKSEASPVEQQLRDLAQAVFRHFYRQDLPLQEILAPERLPIMTFHGFCARLLALAPREAGVPLQFRLLEGPEAEWLKQEALEELRRRLAVRPAQDPGRQALVRRLVRLNNNWPRLAKELRDLLARRDSLRREFLDLARTSQDREGYHRLAEARLTGLLAPALEGLEAHLAASDLGRRWPDFLEELNHGQAPLAARLTLWPPRANLQDLRAWNALAEALLTQKGDLRKKFTPGQGFPPDFQKSYWTETLAALPPELVQLLARFRDLPLPLVSPEETAALQDLVILLGEALSVYEDLCRRQGVLDFVALEEATLRLLELESGSDLLLTLDYHLKHLMVDEFQDTSENQLTLLCRLLEGWEGGGRSLTVVGDPKQSIYGWRQARLRLFLASRRGLPCESGLAFPLEPLTLTTNFRATRTLIHWVNRVFGDTILAAPAGPEKLDFQAAVPAPAALVGDSPGLALFSAADKDQARAAEARWLAQEVANAVKNRQPQETIGILLFARTHLRLYLAALQQAGLAVRVKEGLKLADSRVVMHLHNLAQALVRPHAEVAWAALLAGPWGPQPLAVLAQAARSPGEVWPEKLRAFMAGAICPPRLNRTIAALLAAREQVGRRPLERVLQFFLLETDAWPGISAWEGPAGIANALAYLDLLAQSESGLPEAAFTRTDFHLPEAYQPPDPQAQDSAVELMTVHGGKGLEFDWVFLPYLDWQPLQNEDKTPPFLLEEIPASRLHALALAPPYWQKKSGLLYRGLKDLKNTRVLAEARRVFYVAVTRARRRLCLSAVLGLTKSGELSVPPESPLGWLWRHYQPEPPPMEAPTVWRHPELHVVLRYDYPEPAETSPPPLDLPSPWEFTPEPEPYRLLYPSSLVEIGTEGDALDAISPPPLQTSPPLTIYRGLGGELEGRAGEPRSPGPPLKPFNLEARVRGEVMHRLLETWAQGERLPEAPAVAAALRQGGLPPDAALALAPELLAELAACRADPALQGLLVPGLDKAASEWALEDCPAPGVVRRGRLDRLAFDGQNWWVLDYKTSRPLAGEAWDDFIAREAARYRPQLLAYRDMVARLKGLNPAEVRPALYFTACRRIVEV